MTMMSSQVICLLPLILLPGTDSIFHGSHVCATVEPGCLDKGGRRRANGCLVTYCTIKHTIPCKRSSLLTLLRKKQLVEYGSARARTESLNVTGALAWAVLWDPCLDQSGFPTVWKSKVRQCFRPNFPLCFWCSL